MELITNIDYFFHCSILTENPTIIQALPEKLQIATCQVLDVIFDKAVPVNKDGTNAGLIAVKNYILSIQSHRCLMLWVFDIPRLLFYCLNQ